jgi:hypothetical protein
MRFYNRQHRHYCGIDLHVKTMYVCILDAAGQVLVHRNVPSTPEAFLDVVAAYRDDLVVAAECMFTWYWLADVWAAEGIAFVLGSGAKMGNVHLKWAFSEAAVLFLRHTKDGKKLLARIEKTHGKGKALSILAPKIGRAVFYMLSRGTVFSLEKFRAA